MSDVIPKDIGYGVCPHGDVRCPHGTACALRRCAGCDREFHTIGYFERDWRCTPCWDRQSS